MHTLIRTGDRARVEGRIIAISDGRAAVIETDGGLRSAALLTEIEIVSFSIEPGDHVIRGKGSADPYLVIAMHGQKAWIEPFQHERGAAALVDIAQLTRVRLDPPEEPAPEPVEPPPAPSAPSAAIHAEDFDPRVEAEGAAS